MHKNNSSGFTIIELLLSMAFLSILLLVVVSVTMHTMRIYNKGLTIKQINQAGRSIVEDIARSARQASPDSVSLAAINQGRLCVGGLVYAWNEPEVVGDTNISSNVFSSGSPAQIDIVRLVDPTSPPAYCQDSTLSFDRNSERLSVLSSGYARLLNVQAHTSDDGRLLHLKFSITSTGEDKPVKVGTEYQCPTSEAALAGSFCAIANFETSVYLRNGNDE